jgi:hypothetical protein
LTEHLAPLFTAEDVPSLAAGVPANSSTLFLCSPLRGNDVKQKRNRNQSFRRCRSGDGLAD